MMLQILDSGEQINLQHFRPIKPLGSGDTGRFVLIFSFFPAIISILGIHILRSSYSPGSS